MKDYIQKLEHTFQILDLITLENVNKRKCKGAWFLLSYILYYLDSGTRCQ